MLKTQSIPNFQDVSEEQLTITNDDKWKTFFMYVYGNQVAENCGLCPNTVSALQLIPGLKTAMFSMENLQHDHYFTEKLIDCFVTQTVPIYWGEPSIGEIFDSRGILQFSTIEELTEIQQKLSVSLYEEMLPFIKANRQRAFELKLTGHETLCHRLAEKYVDYQKTIKHIAPISRSKVAAALRKTLDK